LVAQSLLTVLWVSPPGCPRFGLLPGSWGSLLFLFPKTHHQKLTTAPVPGSWVPHLSCRVPQVRFITWVLGFSSLPLSYNSQQKTDNCPFAWLLGSSSLLPGASGSVYYLGLGVLFLFPKTHNQKLTTAPVPGSWVPHLS